MNFEDLKKPGLQEKLRASNSPEELLAIAKEMGAELSDEQLESVSGGAWYGDDAPVQNRMCPFCGSGSLCYNWAGEQLQDVVCNDCGATWKRA